MAGIMHVNARSILSKMQDFQLLIRKIPVNFVALSEPWLNKDTEAQLQLLGYNVVYNFREDRIGGGVAIMVKEGIKFWPLDLEITPKHNTYEAIFIQVQQQKGTDLVIGVVYRPPSQPLQEFNDDLAVLIQILSKRKRRVLIGDFNTDLLKLNTNEPNPFF